MEELLANPDVAKEVVRGSFILLAAIITGLFGLVALLKGGDLLRELRRRKIARIRGKLRHTCPHGDFTVDKEGNVGFRSCGAAVVAEEAERHSRHKVAWVASGIQQEKGKQFATKSRKALAKARRLRERLDKLESD